MRPAISKPDSSEHAPFALTYVNDATAALAEGKFGDVRELLATQCDVLEKMLSGMTDERANKAYAEGKWTLKESLVHVCDTERVFSYRAMRVARGDETPLPGFEQDDYVPESRANNRPLADIVAEFRAIRSASNALVNSLDETALTRSGTASGRPFSVRALCWIIAGHAAHHLTLTRERYLPAI